MSADLWKIRAAKTPDHYLRARQLIQDYANGLPVDLGYQHFAQELKALPEMYGPPAGRLLLAWIEEEAMGCVGVRRIDNDTCEMKRLYVRPEVQGRGLGRLLAERIVQEAQRLGYGRMVLDTLASMKSAQQLYRSLGFTETSAYGSPVSHQVIYLELELS